jgi:hypothetical protein
LMKSRHRVQCCMNVSPTSATGRWDFLDDDFDFLTVLTLACVAKGTYSCGRDSRPVDFEQEAINGSPRGCSCWRAGGNRLLFGYVYTIIGIIMYSSRPFWRHEFQIKHLGGWTFFSVWHLHVSKVRFRLRYCSVIYWALPGIDIFEYPWKDNSGICRRIPNFTWQMGDFASGRRYPTERRLNSCLAHRPRPIQPGSIFQLTLSICVSHRDIPQTCLWA